MPEPKRPVTIEDLLRLKRTERPPAEFWDQFDRALRAKQLAALVEKRPWWRTLPETLGAWRRYARYALPLGATAVLAVTFVALRDRPVSPGGETVTASQPALAAATVALESRASSSETFAPREASPMSVATTLPNQVSAVAAPVEYAAAVTSAPAAANNFLVVSALEGGAIAPMQAASELPPSARHIATNLMVAQITDPSLTRAILATPAAMETTAGRGRASVEPLTQIASAGNTRYARLRTAMATQVVNTAPRETDRVARDLDERLNEDAIRRFNAKGDRFSVKF